MNGGELRNRIQFLVQGDTWFSIQHHKLFFTPDNSDLHIPVETLPIGELGLPRRVDVLRPGEGRFIVNMPQLSSEPKLMCLRHDTHSSSPCLDLD